jgi:hypothetical protein
MSSCNALPQMWAIKPTRTMGCAFKRSCNGAAGTELGALQEICGAKTSARVGAAGMGSKGKVSWIGVQARASAGRRL